MTCEEGKAGRGRSRMTGARVLVGGALLACASLVVALALGVARAGGAELDWRTYLAPPGTCEHDGDPQAPPTTQRRALRCLVNWARAQHGSGRLTPSRALRRAATLKGMRVAACGTLSHAPCGTEVTDAVRATGYRYVRFGETLFATPRRQASARSVVAAWLRSPPHRETLLHPGFRELGAARVEAPTLLGRGATVWVTALATPS